MANPVWIAPNAGDLLNNGQPWKQGDGVVILLQIKVKDHTNPPTLTMVGGDLPPGVYFVSSSTGVLNQSTQQYVLTGRLLGTIGVLDKNIATYPIIFRVTQTTTSGAVQTFDRAFRFQVNPVDQPEYWTDSGTKDLGAWDRGSNVSVQLNLSNVDADPLNYTVVGAQGPQGSFSGLPVGLSIDQFARIVGSPIVTDNPAGDYYFKIYARSPAELLSDPRGEGNPRTSNLLYKITLNANIVADARLSDVVRWITPAGSLGSTYETYPSPFLVLAQPQYAVAGTANDEVQTIQYSMVGSATLPLGLTLDINTGYIVGLCPYVEITRTYTFTIRAQVVFVNQNTGAVRYSSIYSDRTFSCTIRDIFAQDSVMSLSFPVPPQLRLGMVQWITGNAAELREQNIAAGDKVDLSNAKISHAMTIISNDNLFRKQDPNWGRVKNHKILLTSGIAFEDGTLFLSKLRDYHHPTKLRLGELKWAKGKTPDGLYIYDVLYAEVLDPLVGAGGFDGTGKEQILTRTQDTDPTSTKYGQYEPIPQWNLTASDPRYFPTSIANLRADLINTANRNDWVGGNETAATRGIGLTGKEGLPLWMMSEQVDGDPTSVPGYVCAIELCYLTPNSGAGAVKTLTLAGFNTAFEGTTIPLDRYLLLSDGITYTTFDGPISPDTTCATDTQHPCTITDNITTFDGPDNADSPTGEFTTFDLVLKPESKYYKFSPGDKTS